MVETLALEETCTKCNGNRWLDYPSKRTTSGFEKFRCPTCNGRGAVDTDFGKAVLDFVSRRLEVGAGGQLVEPKEF